MSTHTGLPTNAPIVTVIGAPEGRDYAAAATVEADLYTGQLYAKTTDQTQNVGWAQFVTSGTGGVGLVGLDNVAALRAKVFHISNEVAFLLGNLTADDGAGGNYYYSTTSTAVDDGSTVIKPTNVLLANPGRWIKYF